MPTDRRSHRASEHPIDGSLAELASYFSMLARWARGEVNHWDSNISGDRTMSASQR